MATIMAGASAVYAMSNKATRQPLPEEAKFFECYVSIGDSLTQAFMGVGVDETRQPWAYPKQVARQMKTDFNQALIKFPGYYLNLEDLGKGYIRWYHYYYVLTGGSRVDGYDDQEILNNFAITGCDITTAQHETGEKGGFYKLVLGEKGKPQVEQALDRKPTFVSIFLGNNDILGAAVRCNLDELTPVKTFKADYIRLVTRIQYELTENKGTIQGVAVANLPDVSCIAYLDEDPNPESPPGTVKPFFLRQSTESIRLTPDELSQIQARHKEFNSIIEEAVMLNDWALVDIDQAFTDIKDNGRRLLRADGSLSNRSIDAEYLGGLFSLDGIHPSTTGQVIASNIFIDGINSRYETDLEYNDEYQASEEDSLYNDPYDPRVLMDTWAVRGIYFLIDMFA